MEAFWNLWKEALKNQKFSPLASSPMFMLQTVIDGFDAEKFRKVNSKPVTAPSAPKETFWTQRLPQRSAAARDDGGIFVERVRIGNPSISAVAGKMGGALTVPGVPSYDKSERQLLATLEQELGVL